MEIAEIVARMEIHDALMRQLRAMDRHDWDAVYECFHPDAQLHLPHSDGSVGEFVARERDVIYPDFLVSMHFAGNELIEIDGDTATSELYSVCWHRVNRKPGEPHTDHVAGMRYLDRWERRDGAWRIVERTCPMDWSRLDRVEMAYPDEDHSWGADPTP